MNTIRCLRLAAGTIVGLAIASLVATPAQARPEPQSEWYPAATVVCTLQRIGDQFVRCDDLTGAGVSAPAWIEEVGS